MRRIALASTMVLITASGITGITLAAAAPAIRRRSHAARLSGGGHGEPDRQL
jgi:hypothetical protein